MIIFVSGTPRAQPARYRGYARPPSKSFRRWRDSIQNNVRAESIVALKSAIARPVRVDMTFFMPTSKAERAGLPHTSRPDKDNLEKPVLDAMVKAGLLADDKWVTDGRTSKVWAAGSGGVEIRIDEPAEGDDLGAEAL